MSKKYYENRTEAITAAKQFLTKAQEDAEWIYMQRQMEPNIRMLINKFYYSMFYCISAILALKTNEQFKIHNGAINAFNFYIYSNDGFLSHEYVYAASALKGMREEFDYHNANITNEQYELAEKLWLKCYPDLENEVIKSIQEEINKLTNKDGD